ncbi:hypothetical protein [Immundisolibacter sp.]
MTQKQHSIMNQIPLNLVAELLLSHMKVVANPGSKDAFCEAFECATRVWPQYYDDLMKFGDEPLHEVEHDTKFHCMAVLAGAKYKLPKKP